MHREADVGDRPLAEPGDEIETDRGRERHHADEQQEIFEPARDIACGARAVREAFVDDQLERIGHARRRAGGELAKRARRSRYGQGNAQRKAPDHPQVRIERPLGRLVGGMAMSQGS